MDDYDPNSILIEDALKKITKITKKIDSYEYVSLIESHDRILYENIKSKIKVPNYNNSAMDGWAVRSQDKTRIEIGQTSAGEAPTKIGPGEAVRIMTGAPIPDGADAIVMIEDGLQGEARPHFIRRQGENLRAGKVALSKGQQMTPAAISLAATMGHHTIPVRTKLRVAVISTGDELVQPGLELSAVSYTHLTLPTKA